MEPIKIRRVDFYPDDWIAGTISLTHLERSIYITICAAIYAVGGPVETSHVRKLCGGRGFERGLAGLIAKGKVSRQVTSLCNERCMKEVSKASGRVHDARTNGATGGRPIKGLQEPRGSLPRARSAARATPSPPIKRKPSSVGEVAARTSSPYDGATRARDTKKWQPLGDALGSPPPPPPPPDHDHQRRIQQHIEFLKASASPAELQLYLAAQMSDDPDAAQRMFDLTEARLP